MKHYIIHDLQGARNRGGSKTNKTITIHDDRIDIMQDGSNIIEQTIYAENVPDTLIQALTFAADALDMDNEVAIHLLQSLVSALMRGD